MKFGVGKPDIMKVMAKNMDEAVILAKAERIKEGKRYNHIAVYSEQGTLMGVIRQ